MKLPPTIVVLVIFLIAYVVVSLQQSSFEANNDFGKDQLDVDLRLKLRSRIIGPPTEPPFNPAVKDPSRITHLLDFVQSNQTQRYRGYLLVTFLNAAMGDMALNWALHVHRVGLSTRLPLFFCSDEQAYNKLVSHNLRAFLLTNDVMTELQWQNLPEQQGLFTFETPLYNHLVQVKFVIVTYLLKYGERVLFSDVDIVFVAKNPHFMDVAIDALESGPPSLSMLLQNDIADYCTGFYVCRPSVKLVEFMTAICNRMKDLGIHGPWQDQKVLNIMKTEPPFNYTENQPVPVLNNLDTSKFLMGREFFWKQDYYNQFIHAGWPIEHNDKYPYMAHANWLSGYEKHTKIQQFKLWFVDNRKMLAEAGMVKA